MLLYIAGSFVLVVGLITGAYYLLVLVPEGQEQEAVRKRLGGQKKAKAAEAKLLRDREALSKVEFVDRVLTGFTGFTDPLQRLLQQAGLKMTVATLLLTCAGVGFGVALLAQVFLRISWIAIPAGIAAAPIPIFVVRRM